MARGLFLILMTSTHAMTLAGIQSASFLPQWRLPRGWATTGLIMLCGFASLVPGGLAYHQALDMMIGAGAGGFPAIPMIGSGALGFLLGIFWQPPQERFDVDTVLGVILFFVRRASCWARCPGSSASSSAERWWTSVTSS